MENESESIDDLLAMNLSNQTIFNQTKLNQNELNYTAINSSEFNSSEIVSSFFNSLDLNSTELNSSRSGSSDLESSEFEFGDLDFADDYYDSDSYTPMQSEPEVISLAFPATDLNGDNATDLLVMNISSDAGTGAFDSEISAFSGANGSILWQKEYPGSLVFAQSAGDLNGDGLTDVMINEILAASSFIPYSSVSALDGSNGTAIWSRSQ
ncbi:MAG: repeat protein, partial [Euryarchaeota archaeon]|nr:repeat protein [Euryarchaeota archaeon]